MANMSYIMGKSATGKDTIYNRIKQEISINNYVLYTTRPIRTGENEGIDYFFVTANQISEFVNRGKVIESRTYNTVHGPWTYATIADEQLKQEGDILTVGTLESYVKLKDYFKDNDEVDIKPIYIAIDEEERRKRAEAREARQKEPKYAEMERRLKADNIDFSEEKLKEAGITEKETFYNYDLDTCVDKILQYIQNIKQSEQVNIKEKEER